jgi:hypothetical protein
VRITLTNVKPETLQSLLKQPRTQIPVAAVANDKYDTAFLQLTGYFERSYESASAAHATEYGFFAGEPSGHYRCIGFAHIDGTVYAGSFKYLRQKLRTPPSDARYF